MAGSFEGQIAKWVAEVEGGALAIFHESAQRVTDEMNKPVGQGGNLPVDTGYLWHSLTASSSEMPKIREDAKPQSGASYSFNPAPVNLVINSVPIGGVVYIGYVANYSARLNYGFTGTDRLGRQYSQQGRMFVELAAQKWPSIVAQVTNELSARLAFGR